MFKLSWILILSGRGGQGALQILPDRREREESGPGQHQERDHHSDQRNGLAVRPHPQGRKFTSVTLTHEA